MPKSSKKISMDKSSNDYHISLFKPTTESARFNKNLILWLASIWFIAIFGFQIALRVLQKPTPEPSFVAYENVWENIKSGSASDIELQQFGQATLSVLGKVMIEPAEKAILDNAMSWSIHELVPDTMQRMLVEKIVKFETLKAGIANITDEDYINAKRMLTSKLGPKLGLSELDVRSMILPLELASKNITALSDETVSSLPSIMEKYLIHNQSFLTDFKLLGFPFHYFYTAVFLLILFVGLCWLYCVRTDMRNSKLGIED